MRLPTGWKGPQMATSFPDGWFLTRYSPPTKQAPTYTSPQPTGTPISQKRHAYLPEAARSPPHCPLGRLLPAAARQPLCSRAHSSRTHPGVIPIQAKQQKLQDDLDEAENSPNAGIWFGGRKKRTQKRKLRKTKKKKQNKRKSRKSRK